MHLLVAKSRTLLTKDLVKELKRFSTIWLRDQFPVLEGFTWQEGYGAFSEHYSRLTIVRRYIENQAFHHRKLTWEEEYRKLLQRHGADFDERFFLD